MISWNREGILFSPFLSLWVLYVRSQATVCYLLHAGLCPQQHTNGQSAHCLSFGSVTVDAVSLILHSWRLKRGKNHQRSFLASPDITSALCVFFFCFFLLTSGANISWKKIPTLCLYKVPLSSVTLKWLFVPTLAMPNVAYFANVAEIREKYNFLMRSLLKFPTVWRFKCMCF